MRRCGLFQSAAGILAALLVVVLAGPAVAQSAGDERRVALVMGNFVYQHVPRLTNPGNDAALIATTLRQLGFTLIGGNAQDNLDKAHFDAVVQAFGRAIQDADVALFYYAGHGMQVEGSNWLVPIDANPTRPQDLEFQMVNADLVLKQMDGAGTRLNMVILDACRNNPFATLGTRAVQAGLAQMHAPEGTLISFATQPGNVAVDGAGADGPFAMALAASMRRPDVDIFRLFNNVGLAVKRDTGGGQQPWLSSSPIDGDFYFSRTEEAPDPTAALATEAAPTVSRQPGGDRNTQAATNAATGSASPTGQRGSPDAPPPPAAGGATADHDAAARLSALQRLAEQGKSDAQVDLGFAYAKGQGVARDDALARHWFALAAAQGAPKAQYWMGVMFERGRGGRRSYAEALQWYRRAADQGYSPAEVAMGRFYGRGLGIPRDPQQRTEWYRRAADHGNPVGQWALGNFYQFGDGMPKDMPMALQMYQRAAEQGFVAAEFRLGRIYDHGTDVRRDEAEALRWFRLAADAGNAMALNSLGTFYRRGLMVPQDYAQAMRLFRQAADKGNATAAFNIGLLYADGHGVSVDKPLAREWFEKAAAAGNQPAIDRLARIDAGCNAPGGPQRAAGPSSCQP